MFPRHTVARSSFALPAAAALLLVTVIGPSAEASSRRPEVSAHPSSDTAPGLLTGRLSAKQQDRWRSIVALVLAEDHRGPLHPTLRAMWDDVATSRHDVYVELVESRFGYRHAAGTFEVESVRADGHIVAVVRLNLQTIDRAVVGDAADHGFPRFRGLTREGRYLEVLGHELGHAVWALADPARARQVLALQGRLVSATRMLLGAEGEERTEIRRRLRGLSEEAETLEAPARAAEARVWSELVKSRSAGDTMDASFDGRDPDAWSAPGLVASLD